MINKISYAFAGYLMLQCSIGTLAQTVCNDTYIKTLGSKTDDERGYSLAAPIDSQFVYLAGLKNDSVVILRVNESGDIEWTRTFNFIAGRPDHIHGFIVDSEGMIVGAGGSEAPQSGTSVFAFRYDPANNMMLWSQGFNDSRENFSSSIQEIGPGGDFMMLNNPHTGSLNDLEFIKLNRLTGEIIPAASKQYDFGGSDALTEVYHYKGSLYGVGRFTDGAPNTRMRNTILKINPSTGLPDWTLLGHRPGNVDARLYGSDMAIVDDTIYVVSVGDPNGGSLNTTQLYVQKIAQDGKIIWMNRYDIPGSNDWADELIYSDNGFVVLARNRSVPGDMILFKVNKSGNLVWSRNYDFMANATSVQIGGIAAQMLEHNQHIYFTVFTQSSGSEDMVLVKTDLNGEISDTCSAVSPVSIGVSPVSNPVFYFVQPDVISITPEDVSLSTASGKHSTTLISTNCGSSGSITSEIEASICAGDEYEGYFESGTYQDTFVIDSECDSIRILHLTVSDPIHNEIKREICLGEAFEGYTMSGIYLDTFATNIGCDSIRELTLSVISCSAVIWYDLDDCTAYMHDGTNMDYSEFTPEYPVLLNCADITASLAFRSPPQENKHSCTPGLNNSAAMCISALNSCTYVPGHSTSIVIEFSIEPAEDSLVKFTGFTFYEKAPGTYNWIDGPSGPNNYPTSYGIRILKNGIEVFRQEGIQTNQNWSLQNFDFMNLDSFTVSLPANFRIELLPYCLVGNGAAVAAWDLEDIKIFAGCAPNVNGNSEIRGEVTTRWNKSIANARIKLSPHNDVTEPVIEITDQYGKYAFENVQNGITYLLKGEKREGLLNGVNVLDLLRIQKHLLGIIPFTTIEEYIAGDINHSGQINVLDVLDLKKVLLGIIDTFPNNSSWRLGQIKEDKDFSNMSNFLEEIYLENISAPADHNFVGIKIGDLNGNAITSVDGDIIKNRDVMTFDIALSGNESEGNGNIVYNLISLQDAQLEGLQVFLETDMELLSISGGIIPLSEDNYHLVSNQEARIVFHQELPITISKGDILCSLVLEKVASGSNSNSLGIRTDESSSMVCVGNGIQPIRLHKEKLVNTDEFGVKIFPNPFNQYFQMELNLPEPGEVALTIYTVDGKVIHQRAELLPAGNNVLAVNNDIISDYRGIMYCEIIYMDKVELLKLIQSN